MTLDSENVTGLIVSISIYFSLIALAAVFAYYRVRAHAKQSEAIGKQDDVIESHYLGNRNFGPWLTTGSLFASFFSGYTVVGVSESVFEIE